MPDSDLYSEPWMHTSTHSQGLGRTKHAEIVTPVEEEKLWTSDVMNSTIPKGLQNAVFHISLGRNFVFVVVLNREI